MLWGGAFRSFPQPFGSGKRSQPPGGDPRGFHPRINLGAHVPAALEDDDERIRRIADTEERMAEAGGLLLADLRECLDLGRRKRGLQGAGHSGRRLLEDHLLVPVATVRPESHPLVVLGMADAVEAAARSDRLGDISVRLDRYEEWVRAFPNRARLALLARCRAMVDDAKAEPHHARTIELADALPQFERARTELLYGE